MGQRERVNLQFRLQLISNLGSFGSGMATQGCCKLGREHQDFMLVNQPVSGVSCHQKQAWSWARQASLAKGNPSEGLGWELRDRSVLGKWGLWSWRRDAGGACLQIPCREWQQPAGNTEVVLGVAHVDSQFYRNPVAEEKNENGSTQDTTDFQLFTLYPVTWVNSPIIYSILFVNTYVHIYALFKWRWFYLPFQYGYFLLAPLHYLGLSSTMLRWGWWEPTHLTCCSS